MFGKTRAQKSRSVDGGEGRGIPLGGQDKRPATGYRNEEDEWEGEVDRDLSWAAEDDGDPADRRRDPLRR